jgi:hypothetical protein
MEGLDHRDAVRFFDYGKMDGAVEALQRLEPDEG